MHMDNSDLWTALVAAALSVPALIAIWLFSMNLGRAIELLIR
jgi:hypothetical protein